MLILNNYYKKINLFKNKNINKTKLKKIFNQMSLKYKKYKI